MKTLFFVAALLIISVSLHAETFTLIWNDSSETCEEFESISEANKEIRRSIKDRRVLADEKLIWDHKKDGSMDLIGIDVMQFYWLSNETAPLPLIVIGMVRRGNCPQKKGAV